MSRGRSEAAREAARLLYTGACEEYIDAKAQAAASLGFDSSPSNFEVAEELDRIAEEAEGSERMSRLKAMRETALRVMKAAAGFAPRLIGSVWRGTAHKGSDIDLVVYSADPRLVEDALRGFAVQRRKPVQFKGGVRAHQIQFETDGFTLEVVVRAPGDAGVPERCDIYGDERRGLTLPELERLLQVDPYRRFIPRKHQR